MGFWTNYVVGKGQDVEKAAKKMVVGADIEGFTAAAIATQMDKVKELSAKQAAAEKKVKKEKDEATTIVQLQQDRLDGIDVLQAEIASTADQAIIDRNTAIIMQELGKLEAMQPDIAREKQEDIEAEQDLIEIREVLALAKEKLDTMQKSMDNVKNGMERAERDLERNKEKAAIAAEKAGLQQTNNDFDDIMNAANGRLEEIQNKARAAAITAETLTKTDDTSDVMKAAMAKAKGVAPAATMSVAERLAAIKAGK